MNRKIRWVQVAAIIMLFLAGCAEETDPEKRDRNARETMNPDVHARVVATIEGCRVWEISGPGIRSTSAYFVRCGDSVIGTSSAYTTQAGKTRVEHSVSTISDER